MNTRSPRLRWARLLRFGLPLVVLVAAVIAGTLFGVQLVVLTLAGSALLLVIGLLWSSVQALAGETELSFEEAFSLGARSAEEEQKRAVLRALKDLEYERSVGKISEQDYHEYATRYRAEAKHLMQSLDEHLAVARKQVEEEVQRRLQKRGVTAASPAVAEGATVVRDGTVEDLDTASATADAEPVSSARQGRACPACQTKNELDARFCKACGKSLGAAEGVES